MNVEQLNKLLLIYPAVTDTPLPLPFADKGVRAGFPSPAQDFLEYALDFNKDMIKNPDTTFYARVVGNSMIDEGINQGDLLLIDRSIEVTEGVLAVCAVDGDFTLKRIHKEGKRLFLMPANKSFNPIEIKADQQFEVWGVVEYIIKKP
ncbi:MAG: translesion error-prone DNA polymerase V autoproteolytic subunit [Deltaproteobacteria bacterium]|nr:translesion error-prone DNA polymerase V autoproteolytic subunit [Deltaproteobacteria bacterium]